MKIEGCTALITGASAGLGEEFARQLTARARSLVLVARRQDRLTRLRDELQRQRPELPIHIRSVDLADQSEIDGLTQWLDHEKIKIDFLINNAGLGDAGDFVSSDSKRNDEILLVNVVALTRLTKQLLPGMVAQKRGAILNVSSCAGFLPIPDFAIYAATKSYVTSLSEALRAELRGTGVSVTALCPGPVHTEFGDVAKRPGEEPRTGPEFIYVSPQDVVSASLASVAADKPLLIPGFFMKFAMLLGRMTPMPLLRLIWRFQLKRDRS